MKNYHCFRPFFFFFFFHLSVGQWNALTGSMITKGFLRYLYFCYPLSVWGVTNRYPLSLLTRQVSITHMHPPFQFGTVFLTSKLFRSVVFIFSIIGQYDNQNTYHGINSDACMMSSCMGKKHPSSLLQHYTPKIIPKGWNGIMRQCTCVLFVLRSVISFAIFQNLSTPSTLDHSSRMGETSFSTWPPSLPQAERGCSVLYLLLVVL